MLVRDLVYLGCALGLSACASAVSPADATARPDATSDVRDDVVDARLPASAYVGEYAGEYVTTVVSQDPPDGGLGGSRGPARWTIVALDDSRVGLVFGEPFVPARALLADGGPGGECTLVARLEHDRAVIVPGTRCRTDKLATVLTTTVTGEIVVQGRRATVVVEEDAEFTLGSQRHMTRGRHELEGARP